MNPLDTPRRVKRERKRLGISLAACARGAEVSVMTWRRWEDTPALPEYKLETMRRVVRKLGRKLA